MYIILLKVWPLSQVQLEEYSPVTFFREIQKNMQ